MYRIGVLHVVARGPLCPKTRRALSTNGPEIRALKSLKYHNFDRFRLVIAYDFRGALWERFAQYPGIQLVNFPILSKFDLSPVRRLVKIIETEDIDVIHCQGPGSLDFQCAVAAQVTKKPLVITRPIPINLWDRTSIQKLIYRAFDYYTLNTARVVVSVCKTHVPDIIRHSHVHHSKVRVVYNGVDVEEFTLGPFGDEGGQLYTIGTCMQLVRRKRPDRLLRVVKMLSEAIEDMRCLVLGDGPLRSELHATCRSMGIENRIFFAGFQANVAHFFRQMAVFVLLSDSEGLPMAVLEAMASARPVVCTDVGGVREAIINGHNGYVCNVQEIDCIVNRVIDLIESPSRIVEMGLAGRKLAESKFSLETMVRSYERIYEDVI